MLFSLWRLLLDLADRAKSKLGVDLVLKDECFATFAFDYFYFNNRDFFWIELIRNNWRGRSNLYDSDLDEVINALNLKWGELSDFEQKKSDRAGVWARVSRATI